MSELNNRGVSRVLKKLENALSTENYYEAHQIYKTLYFRYISQKKYEDCLELLYRGSLEFLKKEQYTSGADLCISLLDTLEKAENNIDNTLWMQKIGSLIGKMNANIVERETIIVRAIKWSADFSRNNLGHPLMHRLIAEILWSEGNIEQARHHFLMSEDGVSCGKMLIKLSQEKGYSSEKDLFITQIVLQQLCLKNKKAALQTFETYTKFHPKIGYSEPPFEMPLLNFTFFLLKIIENGRLVAFKSLCELYKVSLSRDPSYEKYLQKIGAIFFGITQPQQQEAGGMGGLFSNFVSRLFQELDEEDSDNNQNPREKNLSNSNNRNPITDLD